MDNMKKKKITTVLPIIGVFLIAALLVGGSVSSEEKTVNTEKSDSFTFHTGNVMVFLNGEKIVEEKNTLMEGREAVSQQIRSGSAVSWDTITLGNGTAPTLGDSTLNSEWASCGLSPTTGSFTTGSAGEWNLTVTFNCTCDDIIVNTTAQYSSGATNNYYSGTDFGRNINLYDGDSLEVVWQNDVNSA